MSRKPDTMRPFSAPTEISTRAVAVNALMKLKGIGRRGAIRLIKPAPPQADPQWLYEQVRLNDPTRSLSQIDVMKAWHESERQIEQGHENGVVAHAIVDAGYPERLRRIPDAPAVLFAKGDPAALHSSHAVAIVGTREPTDYGAQVARRSGKTAADAEFTVVSGLAIGCDTHGHEGCLDASGVGVVVLAHGLDRVYPATNRNLAERLLEAGGCLVAEYPYGTAPIRSAFAERDRIQSGLSDGVLVIETDIKGGTMHTVRFTRDQHRSLACIEHPAKWLSAEKTRGNQKLIAEGIATPIPNGAALSTFLLDLKAVKTPAEPPAPTPAQASMEF